MNQLFKAIYSKFRDGGDYFDAIEGRLYYGRAPQNCELPYAVFFGVTSTPEDTFGEEIDEISVQFNNYSDYSSYTQAGDLLEECRDCFDKKSIEVVDRRDVILNREFSTPPWEHDVVWVTSIEFSALMQR
jgi:hypothetical protein